MSGMLRNILILSCFRLFASDELRPPKEIQIISPIIGEVQLSWKPCVTNHSTYIIKYRINISSPELNQQYYTLHCESSTSLALHRGVHAEVATTWWNEESELFSSSSVSAELPPLPGDEGTAAKNLSCQIHTEKSLNISLTCNWTAGEMAPLDTEYYMYYRQYRKTEQCLDYVLERGGQRRVACHVPSSNINILIAYKEVVVLISGTSRSRKIQSIEHVYMIPDIEVLNPPWNVSFREENRNQILVWKKPYSLLSDICFQYEIQTLDLWKNTDKIETVSGTILVNGPLQETWKKHVLRVRAVLTSLCVDKVMYSAWTEPLHIDTVSSRMYILAACVCLIVAGLVFIYICLRFHICGQIFPPVPKPKNELKEIFLNDPHITGLTDMDHWNSLRSTVIISSIEEVCESES
ncbi:interleukin-5 receptor subunit alpha [Pelobates cultripes]|uniref:Interleukin-5 receptor subunit alpha n=1 Tax=Pelobates cultripes TaxID=61616 RepID=A0AAD1SZS6_PELCU|nr:interleukin-5 receptor subunit alpha [Pelobates cultripes]